MDKYKRYLGIVGFVILVIGMLVLIGMGCTKCYERYNSLKDEEAAVQTKLEQKRQEKMRIMQKIARLKKSMITAQKKIYSPIEEKLGDDTLFFTLYSDLIEMVHSNSIKIDSIDYKYNPSGDVFVQQGSTYFVCDVNLKLVSNYVNLGKLVQDIYQYPYYIKINNIDIYPYPKDKKILLTEMSVRLYAHTQPEEAYTSEDTSSVDGNIEGAQTPIPQE